MKTSQERAETLPHVHFENGCGWCDRVASAILAHAEAGREEDAIAVPTNWLDPLLSGPSRVVGDPPYESGQSVQDIERLLRSVQARIRAIKVT